jgi:hypothetical protein
MKPNRNIAAALMLSAVLSFALSSCEGGGGNEPAPAPPLIVAELNSFPAGYIPTGFNSGAVVAVLDISSGAIVTTASVVMNGTTLNYDATKQYYEGSVVVAPGGSVNLSVTASGMTYTASTNQFTSYPAISEPMSGSTLSSSVSNTVTWSGGAPTANASYGVVILDAAHPNSSLIWPLDQAIQDVPIGTTSYAIPAASITAGNRLMVVGISTSGVVIPNAALGSILVVAGFSYVPVTVTGLPLTSRASGTTNPMLGVVWSGTEFVAVGHQGTILASPDGITWTSRTSGTTNYLSDVAWSGTQFVAVGGQILTSPDGITWTSRTSPGCTPTGCKLNRAAWSGTLFVAVGDAGTILTSPDGITWTSRTSPGCTPTGCKLNRAAWSGTLFVAVGDAGTILTSPDGITWTSRTSGVSHDLTDVTWSGTQFVVVGSQFGRATIRTSPDGITWGPQVILISPLLDGLYGVTWSGTQFVAVGARGSILTSSDGITWISMISGTINQLYGVVWSGTEFVAVGAEGTILTSPDGVTWTLEASGTAITLYRAGWSGTEVLIVGENGTILTSP